MAPSGAMATKPKVQRRDGRANAAHNEAGPQIRLERDARVFSICYEEPVIAVEDDRGDPCCHAESDAVNNKLPDDMMLRGHGDGHGSAMPTSVSSMSPRLPYISPSHHLSRFYGFFTQMIYMGCNGL
jgi:hypothetical protein